MPADPGSDVECKYGMVIRFLPGSDVWNGGQIILHSKHCLGNEIKHIGIIFTLKEGRIEEALERCSICIGNGTT
ncbi:hypothetical protein D3C86_1920600 [compost metagenome]